MISELESKLEEFVKNEDFEFIFLINCGGALNLSKYIEQWVGKQKVVLLDSHWPYNHLNITS